MGNHGWVAVADRTGPTAAWGIFDWVHSLWLTAVGAVRSGERMLRQMWETSHVITIIVAVLALLVLILIFFLIRFLVTGAVRGLRRLSVCVMLPASHALRRRRLLQKLSSEPAGAIPEIEELTRNSKKPDIAWLACKVPHDSPLHKHIGAVSALITLWERLPDRNDLTREAVVLQQLYDRLPYLLNYLIRQMHELAVIQHSAGDSPGNYNPIHYTSLIDEAERMRSQIERIINDLPKLIKISFSTDQGRSLILDLKSLANAINDLLRMGPGNT